MGIFSKIWFWLLLAWMALGSYLCWKNYCGGSSAVPSTELSQVTTNSLGNWSINDGDGFKASSSKYLNYLKSNSNYVSPLDADADTLLHSTARYLSGRNDRALNVTGYYKEDEVNDNTFYSNLGLSRANRVKEYLTKLGVPSNQITTEGKLIGSPDWFNGDNLKKGIDFSFLELKKDDTRLGDIRSRLIGKPFSIYFGTNQNQITLTPEQQSLFQDITYYLDNVAAARLDISGHTDNVGNKAANVKLSEERAAFVRDYLKSNGNLPEARMDVAGFGPDKPIASNATSEGKAKNRRVDIALK